MKHERCSFVGLVVIVALGICSTAAAQRPEVGVKVGINISNVPAVSDFYRTQYTPTTPVDDSSGTGLIVGGFITVPIKGRFGLQGELLFSQQRHRVNVPEFHATFTREYVEAALLPRLELSHKGGTEVYLMAGPVFGFKVGADFQTDDPRVKRGDPYRDIYYVAALPYGAPELLQSQQTSVAVAGGVSIRWLLLEVRFTQGLQTVFKDRAGILAGLVQVGGYGPNLEQYYLPQVAPVLERAKSRDLSLLLGVRF